MAKSVSGRLKLNTDVKNSFAFAGLDKLPAAFAKQVQAQFIQMAVAKSGMLKTPLALFLTAELEDQFVMQDLLGGGRSLGEFGLVVAQVHTFLASFSQYMANNIFFNHTTIGKGGSISVATEIRFFVDYAEISSLDGAHYLSDKSMANIEWVKWLLLMGTQKVVENYRITYNPDIVARGNSRSGQAIMVKANSWWWSVPLEFAGTSTDNMIVKALSNMTNPTTGKQVNLMMMNFYQNIFDSIFSGRS